MWRPNHVVVPCGHFKYGQSAESEWSPARFVPFRIARAAEHRDVTSIGLLQIIACATNDPNDRGICSVFMTVTPPVAASSAIGRVELSTSWPNGLIQGRREVNHR
jgi:hypothetical protein